MLYDLMLNEKSFGRELADIFTLYIFPFLGVAGIVWCLWHGILFAKAKDASARDNAKKRLVKGLATLAIIVVLFFVMRTLGGRIEDRDQKKDGGGQRDNPNANAVFSGLNLFDNQSIMEDNKEWKIKM